MKTDSDVSTSNHAPVAAFDQPAVTLTIEELREAVHLGVERILRSLAEGRRPRFPYAHGQMWSAHIMGALGEAVVRKHTGWPWPKGVNTFRSVPDVGNAEVRWNSGVWRYGRDVPLLKIRNDERPGTRCILVSGEAPTFVVRGWIESQDASSLGWRDESKPPCWWVSHLRLRPIAELERVVAEETRINQGEE